MGSIGSAGNPGEQPVFSTQQIMMIEMLRPLIADEDIFHSASFAKNATATE